jgi:D-alanine-D-alanine ligase-like ATP-grasp enzyme
MSKKTIISPIIGPILQKLAPIIGAKIIIEPEWGIVGQIIFKNGKKRYFRYTSLDLNTLGASEIAKDKDYASFFMKKLGYPVITGRTFFSDSWCQAIGSKRNIAAAYAYACQIGFPVIVKPNSGSQGTNVIKVNNKKELYAAMRLVFTQDKVALVQQLIKGRDYRVVVLDKQIISAYERLPFSIIGDGKTNIKNLITRKLRELQNLQRPARLSINDHRLLQKLKEKHLTFISIPKVGERIELLDNANLSTGGESFDVTKNIHPQFKKICIQLTKDMGLRLSGVDLMIEGKISDTPKKYKVIEINAAPGLDHYIRSGAEQEKIVENLYLQVLKAMQK